jgi:hypothetical protein
MLSASIGRQMSTSLWSPLLPIPTGRALVCARRDPLIQRIWVKAQTIHARCIRAFGYLMRFINTSDRSRAAVWARATKTLQMSWGWCRAVVLLSLVVVGLMTIPKFVEASDARLIGSGDTEVVHRSLDGLPIGGRSFQVLPQLTNGVMPTHAANAAVSREWTAVQAGTHSEPARAESDFLWHALKVLPVVGASWQALVGYVVTVVAWLMAVYRVHRSATVLATLEKVPEKDRARVLERELGGAFLADGMSAKQYLRHQRQQYVSYAIIATVVTIAFLLFMAVARSAVSIAPFERERDSEPCRFLMFDLRTDPRKIQLRLDGADLRTTSAELHRTMAVLRQYGVGDVWICRYASRKASDSQRRKSMPRCV